MTKRALLVGCGSKWGAVFTKHLASKGYLIDLITSSSVQDPNVNNLIVDWYALGSNNIKSMLNQKTYDLIFFNQNSGGGPNDQCFKPGIDYDINSWNHQNWINCQLPYVIVKHLSPSITDDTKIGWMLTGLIAGREKDKFQYAGYASVKSTNLHLMRGFSEYHPGIFFAINPIWFPIEDYEKDAVQISNVINQLQKQDSGKSFNKDGSEWI